MSDLEKQELQQKILELEEDIRKLRQNLNKDNDTLSAMEVKLQALKYIAWDRQSKRESSSMYKVLKYKVLKGEKDYTRDWGEGSRLLTAHSETGRGERGQLRQEFNDRNFHNPASDTIIPQNSNKSQISSENSHNQAQEPKQPRADEILFNGYKEIRKEQESNITQTTQQASVDGDIDINTSPRGPRL